MKRPPIVIVTILLFGFFVIMGSLSAVKVFPLGFGKFIAASMVPILFLVGWFGVLLKKDWARVYGAAIILVNALIMILVAVPIINRSGSGSNLGLAASVTAIFLFEFLWAYRLGLGKASKEYFQSNANV